MLFSPFRFPWNPGSMASGLRNHHTSTRPEILPLSGSLSRFPYLRRLLHRLVGFTVGYLGPQVGQPDADEHEDDLAGGSFFGLFGEGLQFLDRRPVGGIQDYRQHAAGEKLGGGIRSPLPDDLRHVLDIPDDAVGFVA